MAGRPPKDDSERLDDMLQIRIKSAERATFDKAAKADQRSLSAWARLQLLKAASQKPKPEK